MKKLTSVFIISFVVINVSCQSDNFLSYFPDIDNDSIIDTRENLNNYYQIFQERVFPDSISLKYFFENDTNKMRAVFESYNMDEDKYTYTYYTKKISPLLKKKHKNLYLLHYNIESKLYLAIYNPENNMIISTLKVSDFSDELGNVVTHSTIFPNNYIVTTQINDRIYYRLLKIDYSVTEFKELKKIEVKENKVEQNKIINEAYSVLGITGKGELIE